MPIGGAADGVIVACLCVLSMSGVLSVVPQEGLWLLSWDMHLIVMVSIYTLISVYYILISVYYTLISVLVMCCGVLQMMCTLMLKRSLCEYSM